MKLFADSLYRFVVRIEDEPLPELHGWIISEGQLNNFFLYYQGDIQNSLVLFCIMAGMLLMMWLYISSKFIQLQSPEYGYYSAYVGFLLGFVVFRTFIVITPSITVQLGNWYYFVNNQLQVCAYCMYFPFFAAFIKTKKTNPSLHRLFYFLPIVLMSYIALDGVLIINEKIEFHHFLWDAIRVILLFIVLLIAFRVYRMRTPFGKYPILGGVSLDFFALMAMVFSIHPEWVDSLIPPFNSGIFYYFVGISIELVFFSLGLGLKNRRDELEKVQAQQALKFADERLKFEQFKTVVEVQESERARIAKDLHDGIGGTLSGIKISLTNLMPHLSLGEKEKLQYERSIDLLNNSAEELRIVSHNMMPPSITQFGLVAALRDFCESINTMKTLRINMQVLGVEIRLSGLNEIILYRIVQELINNIVKHARASNALLQLSYDNPQLSITVEDNGIGFDPKQIVEVTSSGWKNIRSRVDFLKGAIDIRSTGSGTSIHVQIPTLISPKKGILNFELDPIPPSAQLRNEK